ncbi:lysozyme [Pseudothauera nasutitermitis]|uniref:Lysozyme n=1 Tax=Pseudothauera nasutitermitis TaxID=2565930 RepID=A0A4S4AP41_9RHOO|nr:lysozyme [Pseudothauera nasutitermitis]THF61403.1 lysozyme [Pseudothauera nasutitermitis]
MNKGARILAGSLSLSAAAFVGLLVSEGYSERAVIPTQNDRPTLGFGSTFHESGAPVRLGETTTPVRAVVKAQAHIGQEEARFRATIPDVPLHQAEYDVYMDWVYQYGTGAWSGSGMRRHLLAGEYRGACGALLAYRYLTSATPTPGWEPYRFDAAGQPARWRFDCCTPGNRVCAGVCTRQRERHEKCMAVQE